MALEVFLGAAEAMNYKKEYDSLIVEFKNKEQREAEAVQYAMYWRDQKDSIETELYKAESVIDYREKEIMRLTKTGDKISKEQPKENPLKNAYDSLSQAAKLLLDDINTFADETYRLNIANDSLRKYMADQLRIKDELYDACRKALDYGAKEVLPQLKPRISFYIGGSVIGNKQTIFSGYGADLSMLTKKGTMYSAGSKWVNGIQYFEGGVKFRLSFRKK